MAYGTGDIPFIRTSDIADWEVKRDTRHGVSEAIYRANEERAGAKDGDILLVRDGTYLVGSTAFVTGDDLPALFCGGIYRIRAEPMWGVSAYALLAALNLPVVRKQMRARQFTRDVIDTLGNRLLEVRIPSPQSAPWLAIGEELANVMARKQTTKQRIGAVIAAIEPAAPPILQGRPSWSMR